MANTPMTEDQGDEIIRLLQQVVGNLEDINRDIDGLQATLISIAATAEGIQGTVDRIEP